MSQHRCPTCKRACELDVARNPFRPFCCERCRTIDLGRWIGEEIGVPVEAPDGEPPPVLHDDEN